MTLILLITFFIFIISNLMMFLSTILSKKKKLNREKNSPFECGFDPKSFSRIPFSLHFFLITVIFLIFDVEIALIFPLITTFNSVNMIYWIITSLFFILILLMGLYHEWNNNMLNWTI